MTWIMFAPSIRAYICDQDNIFETFNDIIQSIFFTRSKGLEKHMRTRFVDADATYLRGSIRVFKTESYLNSFNALFSGAVPSFVLVLAVSLILDTRMTLGGYFAFTSFLSFFIGSIQFFLSQNTSFQRLRVSYDRICEVFSWPVAEEFKTHGEKRVITPSHVHVLNLSFTYPNSQDVALDNLNFTVEPGEKVALMGKSGSGKSTLLKLLLGLYEPDSGEIILDAIPSKDLDFQKVRRRIAFVQQEPLLLEGTLRDNIRLFAPKPRVNDDAKIQRCLEVANVADLVARLPDGLDTPVLRFGNNFSVGERQRLSLAGALYRDANLILMDEPTSSIDAAATRSIMDSIQKIPDHVAVIIASHDPAVVQCTTRTLVIEHGKLHSATNPPRKAPQPALAV